MKYYEIGLNIGFVDTKGKTIFVVDVLEQVLLRKKSN